MRRSGLNDDTKAPMARHITLPGRSRTSRAGSVLAAVFLLGPIACGESTGPEGDRVSEQRFLWEAD